MDRDIGAALASAARTISSRTTLDETLATIVETARNSLPGFDEVGISTMDNKGAVHTRAGTSEFVWELDRIQYSLGEGPCVDSLRDTSVVTAPHIRDDQRWPQFVPLAVELGLKSQLAVRLYLDDEGTLGGLNIYSTTSEDIDPDAECIAELFATHAAIALGNAREVDSLQEALRTRKMIGQALGMLMTEYTLDEDAAFGLLVRTSSVTNVKLRDIAADMVKDANARAVDKSSAKRASRSSTPSDPIAALVKDRRR